MTLNTSPTSKNSRWTPPPPGVFKVNVDRATSEDGRNLSVRAIIRDPCGVVIAACYKYLENQACLRLLPHCHLHHDVRIGGLDSW